MRGLPISSLNCSICSSHFEDVDHAIFRCHFSIQVWKSVVTLCGLPSIFLWDVNNLFSTDVLGKVPPSSHGILQAISLGCGLGNLESLKQTCHGVEMSESFGHYLRYSNYLPSLDIMPEKGVI